MLRETVTVLRIDTLVIFDSARDRSIPIAIYQPKDSSISNKIPVIFIHGYGGNKGDDYIHNYTYLTNFLASKGYYVVSVQHELPTDEPLPMSGSFQVTRKPHWERGVENIRYTLHWLRRMNPGLKFESLSLVGHSNGGDISMLLAHTNPALVYKVISLDNRRMPIPRVSVPKLFTIRSNDSPADDGVLPTLEEQLLHGITVWGSAIHHNDMDDHASEEERAWLSAKVLECLK